MKIKLTLLTIITCMTFIFANQDCCCKNKNSETSSSYQEHTKLKNNEKSTAEKLDEEIITQFNNIKSFIIEKDKPDGFMSIYLSTNETYIVQYNAICQIYQIKNSIIFTHYSGIIRDGIKTQFNFNDNKIAVNFRKQLNFIVFNKLEE
jgi:hypothetical protein